MAALCGFFCVLGIYGQSAFVYPGALITRDEPIGNPGAAHMPYENLRLTTCDGIQLSGYLLTQKINIPRAQPVTTSATDDIQFARSRPTIIVFHGNAENYGDGIPFARKLYLGLRLNVVLASYRGYAGSTGKPSQAGIRIDAQTVLDHVIRHSILGYTRIIVYGLSLGGAVAIDLASRNPGSISGLIIENSFLSLPKMLPQLMPSLSAFKFLVGDKWNSEQSITQISPITPILFLSGAKDEVVPVEHMQKLHQLATTAAAGASTRLFVSFEDGMHNNTSQQPTYWRSLRAFLGSVLKTAS